MRFATLADKALLEGIVNNPILRAWNSFEGAPLCDASKYLEAPIITVVGDEGCFLALRIDPGRYVIHTNLLPHCRGQDAIKAAMEALSKAFIESDATELLTMVPRSMPHAKWLALKMGFRSRFSRNALWPTCGTRVDTEFMGLDIEDWIAQGHYSAAGEAFHSQIHGERRELPFHPPDPVHDAFVGAAVEMIKRGNVRKAVHTYNRWARFALYEPIKLVSQHPLRIDIGHSVLRIEGDRFEVEVTHA